MSSSALKTLPEANGTFVVGQRERLTVRLKGLIRQYQRGPGIVKEFIQNADDAGAAWVHVLMDWRDFRSKVALDDPIRAILGPALLIANGSRFTDPDFDDIQRIGESPKRFMSAKTGRFGLGFNTAYNVTDYPSFISRDRLYCFDPHEDSVAIKGQSGCGYTLARLASEFPAWLESFSGAGVDLSSEPFDGTVFRLPLRDVDRAQVSEITHEPFDSPAFDQIVERLKRDGPSMLLFTRHVLNLRIQEIPAEGGDAHTILVICTVNADEVMRSRRSVHEIANIERDLLIKELEEGRAPKSTHRHQMLIERGSTATDAEWHVQIGYYPDSTGELIRQSERLFEFDEVAVPEAGVAIALARRSSGALVPEACDGLFCCGLPLPAETGLPVHINACFDLDDSRTRPTVEGATSESGRARAEWNRLLLHHAIAEAYADAVETLPDSVLAEDPGAIYDLWPAVDAVGLKLFAGTSNALSQALAERPIFRCRTKGGIEQKSLAGISLLQNDVEGLFADAMIAEGHAVPAPPVPERVVDGAASAGIAITRITPRLLRAAWKRAAHLDCDLQEAPFSALRRRDWLEACTRFVLSDGLCDLAGLPLALLLNGQLAAFGLAKAGLTFAGSDEQRKLFGSQSYWFIDPGYMAVTGLMPQDSARFFAMTARHVATHLPKVLPTISDPAIRMWDPAGAAIPNETWLQTLIQYLTDHVSEIGRKDLETLSIVPDQSGRLHLPFQTTTPLLRPKSKALEHALEQLPLPLISGSDELRLAFETYAHAHPDPGIFAAEGKDLLDTLIYWREEWRENWVQFSPDVHAPILDVLQDMTWVVNVAGDELQEFREVVRDTPLFATDGGGVLAANAPDFYLAAGEQPPTVSGRISLANLGPHDKWRELLEWAEIPPLDLPTIIGSVLLPAFEAQSPSAQIEVLRYIRDNLSRALAEEEEGAREARGARQLERQLRSARIIRGDEGELHAASELYAPDLRDVVGILGDVAHFPDMALYPAPQGVWLSFLRSLGLKDKIRANDLVARIDRLTAGVPTPQSKRQMAGILGFIQKHWDELKDQKVKSGGAAYETLATALKGRKWLPADDQGRFPGFAPSENRFFLPSEVYLKSAGHLVAGEAPLLLGGAASNSILTALGLPSWPPLALVLKRFDRLIALVTGPEPENLKPDELKTTFDEIYRFLGQAAARSGGTRPIIPLKVSYENRPCIWDPSRRCLRKPKDVFADHVSYFEPHKTRIDADTRVAAGLDALGRRVRPETRDYEEFLRALAAFKKGALCDEREKGQAIHALEELGKANGSNVIAGDIPVLTGRGHLVALSNVFKMDAPFWRNRFKDSDLEFINSDISAPRILAACRGISEASREVLESEPLPSRDRDTEALCFRLQNLIRSHEFSNALVRLASHECGYRLLSYSLDLVDVSVRAAIEIHTSVLVEHDDAVVRVGSAHVDFFVDSETQIVWIATRSIRSVQPKMAKAINRLMGEHSLRDLSPLEAILRGRKEQIGPELDERGIMSWDVTGRPRLDWSHSPDDVAEQSDPGAPTGGSDDPFDTGDDADASRTGERSASLDNSDEEISDAGADDTGADEADNNDNDRVPLRVAGNHVLPPVPAAGPVPVSRGQSAPPPPGIVPGSQHSGGAHPRGGSSNAPPTAPGYGQSFGTPGGQSQRPAGPTPGSDQGRDIAARGGGEERGAASRAPRSRFVTYVASDASESPDDDTDVPDGSEAHERDMAISRAAVRRVLAYEESVGRTAREMSHTNPGYDVESTGAAGGIHYIEVKGIEGPWDQAGVRLSGRQFRFAQDMDLAAWLYVVEFARDDGRAFVYRIQNPANKANVFCFDQGWRAAAGEEPEAAPRPPTEGETIILEDGEVVLVTAVARFGALTKLTIQSADGAESVRVWRPSLKRAVGDS